MKQKNFSPGGFCPGDFCLGGFCLGVFVLGAFCPGGFCQGVYVRGGFVPEPLRVVTQFLFHAFPVFFINSRAAIGKNCARGFSYKCEIWCAGTCYDIEHI